MIDDSGQNSIGETYWTLKVPDEHCQLGLEVCIRATDSGLVIGGCVINWEKLEEAKKLATRI